MTLIIEVSCRGVSGTRRLELEAGQELVVGRDNMELLLAKDQTLSRKHFCLSYTEDSIVVKHLSRTNPTLMASEGSSDFQKVIDSQCGHRACRIIAGAHRFVAAIETPDSATISGNSLEIWSDVDEDSISASAIENGLTASSPNRVQRQSEEVVGQPARPLRDPVPTEEKPVFSWDDSIRENIEPPTIEEQSKSPQESSDLPNSPMAPFAEEPAKPVSANRSDKDSPRVENEAKQKLEEKRAPKKDDLIPRKDDLIPRDEDLIPRDEDFFD